MIEGRRFDVHAAAAGEGRAPGVGLMIGAAAADTANQAMNEGRDLTGGEAEDYASGCGEEAGVAVLAVDPQVMGAYFRLQTDILVEVVRAASQESPGVGLVAERQRGSIRLERINGIVRGEIAVAEEDVSAGWCITVRVGWVWVRSERSGQPALRPGPQEPRPRTQISEGGIACCILRKSS